MFFLRMAAKGTQRLLLLWGSGITTIPMASATPTATTTSMPANVTTSSGFRLSPDITNFIPSCALPCFKSFIDINFNASTCGSSPSLQCLCQHTGSSGYTIGEGATECIVAENNIGRCHGMNYGSQTVSDAYGMCNNQTGAAPETHATLIATLIVESGSVVLAPLTPTPTPTRTATTVTAQNSTSAFVAHTSVTSTSSTAISSTTAPAPPSSTTGATAASKSSLSSAQIGGIAGGVAAAAVLAALLALFIFLRRRHGFARVRDSWSPKRSQGSPGSLPISQPQYKEPKMMSFTRALGRYSRSGNARPGTIGLAISPGASGTYGANRLPGTGVGLQSVESVAWTPDRQRLVVRNVPPSPPVNKLPSPPPPAMSPQRAVSSFKFFPEEQVLSQEALPTQTFSNQPRPNLTVAIPRRQSTASINHMPFHGGRDSVVTEFAEDGEDSETGPGSAQIWRPPTTDPSSATTYYVADKWGNWVLGGGTHPNQKAEEPMAELATPISKTAEEREAELKQQSEYSGSVQDSNAVKAAQKELSSQTLQEAVALRNMPKTGTSRAYGGMSRSTIRLVTPDSGRLPVNSRSSSVYSSYSLPPYVVPTADNPLPSGTSTALAQALHAGRDAASRGADGDGTRSSSQKRRSDRRMQPDRQMLRDSGTTIMSQDSATTIADSPVEAATLAEFPLPARTSSLRHRQSATQQRNLSPVVESPGRSPVRYPEIPRSQSNGDMRAQGAGAKRSLLPNPAVTRIAAQSRPSDSPTLGTTGPAPARPEQTAGAARRDVTPKGGPGPHRGHAAPASLKAHPDRPPGGSRTGSPDMHGGDQVLVVPKKRTPATDRARLPSQSNSRSLSHAPPAYGPPPSAYDAYNDPSRPQRPGGQGRYEPSPETRQDSLFAQQQPAFVPSPASASEEVFYSSAAAAASTPEQQQQQQQAHDGAAAGGPGGGGGGGGGSGLLAKRLGAERAAGFQQIEGGRGHGRQQQQQQKQQPQHGWARVLTPRGFVVQQQQQQQREGETERETYVQLPATPGWQPQLTPKKRGDDLYLSVK